MAKTEITKILIRRGSEEHRRQLHDYGGLDQGEPGYTSSSEQTTSEQNAAGFVSSYPAMSGVTWPTSRPSGANGAVTDKSGGDLWIGGSGAAGEDIYIGGQSSEFYNQMRFLSISGTDLNHNGSGGGDYLQGQLIIGQDGVGYDFKVYGTTSGKYLHWDTSINTLDVHGHVRLYDNAGSGGVRWYYDTSQFNIDTTVALKVPVGTSAQRPRWNDLDGTPAGSTGSGSAATGHIRFNTTNETYEGYVHNDALSGGTWGSLGGTSDVVNQTYVTVRQNDPAWAEPHTGYTDAQVKGLSAHIKFVVGNEEDGDMKATLAGYFDNARNFYVTNDIVAFNTSDIRQKDNIKTIQNPVEKLNQIKGVEFDWNEKGPAWVGDDRGDVGLLAQDVENVLPQAVTDREDGYKAVDYNRVIPLLVETIKTLNAKVEYLESKIL